MRPSPDLAGKIERADAAVNTFLQARSRMEDFEAANRAVRRYPGLDPEGRTRAGGVRRDYAAVVLSDLLADLALWEDLHGHGGHEMLRELRIRWPFSELDGPARHLAAELVSFATEHNVSLREAADKALSVYTEEWRDAESHWKQQAAQGAVPADTTGLSYTVAPTTSPSPGGPVAEEFNLPTAAAALGLFLTRDRPDSPVQMTQLQADGSHKPLDHTALWADVLEETGPTGEWDYVRAAWFDQAHMTWKEAAHRVDEHYLDPVEQATRDESRYSPVMLFRLRAALVASHQYEFWQEDYGKSHVEALDEVLKKFVEQTGLPHEADEPETAAALLANLALILDTQGLPGRLLLQPANTAEPMWPKQTGLAGDLAVLLHDRFRSPAGLFSSLLQQAQAIHDAQWGAEADYLAEQVRSGHLNARTPLRYTLSSPARASNPAFEQECPNAAVAWLEFLQHDTPQQPVEITATLADGRRAPVDLAALAHDAHIELHHEDGWNWLDGDLEQDRTHREEQAQAAWLRRQLADTSARPDRAAPRRERIETVFGSSDLALSFLRHRVGHASPDASIREQEALRRAETALTRLFAQTPDAGRTDRLRTAALAAIAESSARQEDLAAATPQTNSLPAAAEQTDHPQHHHQAAQTPGTAVPRP
ncbi:hypothetical protein [Streptomyces sp. NPDC001165]|uniref:hypothetical protein n=1 Tax=Streptomyces sp. NPDC001165 TaxID=3364546 RepID=UPI0036A05C05